MRKALIVGIDHYDHIGSLSGCVRDAHAVQSALGRHADGTLNFGSPNVLTAAKSDEAVTRSTLRSAVQELFADDAEIALLFFAGHGFADDTGGFLFTTDTDEGPEGLALSTVMQFANDSPARNKMVILDSCQSGAAGNAPILGGLAAISDGVTVLTASTEKQYALGSNQGGVFTNLFVDALSGAAANLVGDITPGSVYAHIDQSLGPWAQRPVFKTNVKNFVSLRKAEAPIDLVDLRAIVDHFPTASHVFQLDPSFEPERSQEQLDDGAIPDPDPANVAVFRRLQRYVSVNLARPTGAPHMWHAAMQSTGCELTVLGQHYWDLVHRGLI